MKKKKNDKNQDTFKLYDYNFFNFIFLNLELLESFMSQKHNGFPQNIQTEKVLEHIESKIGRQASTEASIEGKLDKLNLFSGKFKATLNGSRSDLSNAEAKKSIISKTQSDNMYNEFVQYIEHNNLTTNNIDVEPGKYIKLCQEFYYIDFERIHDLYSKNLNGLYPQKEEIEDTKNKIDLISELIPFDAILYSQEFIVLIDKDYLKVKKGQLGYTLNGNINVLGKVEKCINIEHTSDKPKLIKTLDEMQKYAISLLRELGFIKVEKAYLVIPIAIYY